MNFETIKKYLGKRTLIVAAALGFPIVVGGIYLAVGTIVTFVLIFVIIGLFLLPFLAALIIAWVDFGILGAVRANSGFAYRYPLAIRFVS